MRLTAILLYTISFSSSAQNWQLIHADYHYHYKLGDSPIISQTIFADSVHMNGDESIFYLNDVLLPCDTCYALSELYCPANDCVYSRFGHQFLQQEMSILTDGIVVLNNPDEIFIHTYSSEGDIWDFDPSQNIIATVDSIREEFVFDELDSIKFISLNNGRFIQLSKNHGVLKFPDFATANDYLLCGISGPEIGEFLPSIKDVFNFQPGDELMYLRMGSSPFSCWEGSYKIRYTDRIDYDDSIHYEYDQISNYTSWDCIMWQDPGSYSESVISESVTYSKENYPEIVNAAPHGTTRSTTFSSPYNQWTNNNASDHFASCDISKPEDRYIISYGQPDAMSCQFFVTPYGATDSSFVINALFSEYYLSCYNEIPTYTQGLGLTHYIQTDNFESGEGITQIGAVLQGDTIGTVYSDDFILSLDDAVQKTDLRIYPNPVSSTLNIASGELISEIKILDLTGKIVDSIFIHKMNAQLVVENYPEGIYFLQIKFESGISLNRSACIFH